MGWIKNVLIYDNYIPNSNEIQTTQVIMSPTQTMPIVKEIPRNCHTC